MCRPFVSRVRGTWEQGGFPFEPKVYHKGIQVCRFCLGLNRLGQREIGYIVSKAQNVYVFSSFDGSDFWGKTCQAIELHLCVCVFFRFFFLHLMVLGFWG